MRTLLKNGLMILLIAVGTFAQGQPPPSGPRFPQPGGFGGGYGVAQPAAKPSTNNYQLELAIQRSNKTARYKLTLNSGAVTTELMDRFAEHQEGLPPQTISLNVVFSPFE